MTSRPNLVASANLATLLYTKIEVRNKMNEKNLEELIDKKVFTNIHYINEVANIEKLPLVLTNADLKKEFQISDSTLNRLINYAEFPSCWKGIRGHYSREDIIKWYRDKNSEKFTQTVKEIRSI